MLTFNRHAALGNLDVTSRRHAAAGQRNVTPFLTAEEAGPEWGEETAKYSAQYERIMATLDNPHPDQDRVTPTKIAVSKA
jgi:hypothetical protein